MHLEFVLNHYLHVIRLNKCNYIVLLSLPATTSLQTCLLSIYIKVQKTSTTICVIISENHLNFNLDFEFYILAH